MNPINNNNYLNFSQNAFQPYQATQYFLQPQGNVYMVGGANEVGNVPIGAGLSAAICLKEGAIYLKTIQNGSPLLLGYKLCPLENNSSPQESKPQETTPVALESAPANDKETRLLNLLEDFEERLKKLEERNLAKGGSEKWQL